MLAAAGSCEYRMAKMVLESFGEDDDGRARFVRLTDKVSALRARPDYTPTSTPRMTNQCDPSPVLKCPDVAQEHPYPEGGGCRCGCLSVVRYRVCRAKGARLSTTSSSILPCPGMPAIAKHAHLWGSCLTTAPNRVLKHG